MPVCPQCDNRPFANKEALLQHMKTSSAWHPVCITCDRRFASQDAYNAHMNDKHPPTFDCLLCNRQFAAPYALEDHYRGSQLHPNCVRCGRGFKDNAACDEHYRTAHPKVPCEPCGGIVLYADTLEQHYQDSGNHPSCEQCNRGFKDSSAYNHHLPIAHPERYCAQCQTCFEAPEALQSHLLESPNHPNCTHCNIGFTDALSHNMHLEKDHRSPEAPGSNIDNESFDLDLNLAMIVGERKRDSPDLRLDFLTYASPLTEVKPLFSPTAPSPLPKPGDNIERFWTSKENITTSRLPLTPSPRLFSTSQIPSVAEPQTYRHSDPGPSRNSDASWIDTTPPVFQPRELGRRISPPQVSPPLVPTSLMSPQLMPAASTYAGPLTDFNSRLYPGSARQAMRAASLHRHSPASSESGTLQYYKRMGAPLDDFSLGSRRSFDAKGLGGSGLRTASLASQSTSSLGRYRGGSLDWPTGAFTSTPLLSEAPLTATSTPTVTTLTTPKVEVAESAAAGIVYTITPSSECPSPHSPEVSSPAGLGILPVISPLAASPVDLDLFDFPEARKPLPDSPPVESLSPVTVILDIPPVGDKIEEFDVYVPQESSSEAPPVLVLSSNPAPTLATSPSLSNSSSSYVTSPQEPPDDTPTADTAFTSSTLSLSPRLETSATGSTFVGSPTVIPSSRLEAVPLSATRSNRSTTSTSVGGGFHPKPLHCRVCLADTCDDITASMCGHIFCNRCITDAVIKTNRCPVCQTPTLLYCLFRLDLGA